MKKIVFVVFVMLCLSVNAFAAPGDLSVGGNATVNGNLGVGTTTPTQKVEVNGNVKATGLCIGTSCTSTLHVSGGLYGFCKIYGVTCNNVKSPATCASAVCACPSGYTLVQLGAWGIVNNDGYDDYFHKTFVCYKN